MSKRIGPRSIWLLPLTLAIAVGGCQSYERQPLDSAAARDAWLARSTNLASASEFAATLDRVEGESHPFDPSDGLSLREAEAVALVFNADLRLARLEANVAAATARHAGLWDDPVLGVDLERIISGVGGDNPWVAGGTIGLSIPISGRLEAEKARAGATAAAELDRVAALEWATRAALRELWIEWSAATIRAEIGGDLVSRLRDVAGLADRQGRAGSISPAEARVFGVELAGREADQIGLELRRVELEVQIRQLLGLPPDAAIALNPAIGFMPRAFGGQDPLAELERSNPELAAIRSEYEIAEHALRAQVRRQYPDLQIGPGYASDQGDDRLLLGVSAPIPLWNRNRQAIAEADAQRDAARGKFETTYERLASSLALAETRLEAARRQREAIEHSLVPLADEQEADVRRIAGLGRVEPLLLLEAIQAQHEARVRLIDAREAESIGAARLEELLGPPAAPGGAPNRNETSPSTPPTPATPEATSTP